MSAPGSGPALPRMRGHMWEGGWLAVGSVGAVPSHAHHAHQISLALDRDLRVRGEDEEWRRHRGAVVLADTVHAFDATGGLVAMLFVDPESREGRWLGRSVGGSIAAVDDAVIDECAPGLRAFRDGRTDAQGTAELVRSVVRKLCVGIPPQRAVDSRIVRALEILRAMDSSRIVIEPVAKAVFLSPSRFAHLFTEQVGLPFRRYVLWRKLNRAIVAIAQGNTLSAAAHLAGFSDAAHLTRTFHQMLGATPSGLMVHGDFHTIPSPFD